MILKPGDRCFTKYGPATVVGFECFSPDGRSSYLVYEDVEGSSSRVRCKLDKPENWSLSESGGDPYFWCSDLQQLSLVGAGEEPLFNGTPGCKHETYNAPGGGIKCVHCPGWFCY